MESKTHVACANAVALAIMQPRDIKSLSVCVVSATIGSLICDLDVSTEKNHKYIDYFSLFIILGLLLLCLLDTKLNIGINNWIVHNSSYLRIISCLLVTIFVCYYGYRQPHRSFLHSFLGLFILSFLCYFAFGNIVISFSIGLITHIILDLFNLKGLRLFYPLKNKYSLKLCVYNGKVNNILFYIFCLLITIELIIYGII